MGREPTPWWCRVVKLIRYSMVSVMGVAITQALLVVGHAVVGLGPATANTVAVLCAALPVFLVNRTWVWKVAGPSSLQREIAPFWAFTIAGLMLSTFAVGTAASMTDSTLALSAANLGAFGVLWVLKFFVLDAVVFATADGDDLVAA